MHRRFPVGLSSFPLFFRSIVPLAAAAAAALPLAASLGCAAGAVEEAEDAGADVLVTNSGPPSTYDSGPPAEPYGDGGDDAAADAPEAGAHTGPCAAPSDCPGTGDHDNVTCVKGACDLSCQGEFYDVNGDPSDGCEKVDSPIDRHTSSKPVDLGSFPCTDTASTQNVSGVVPSDQRAHENPTPDGFAPSIGAAPDWYQIEATGGALCQDDVNLDIQMNAVKQPSCYKLTVYTDKSGPNGYACDTDASGHCAITNGKGSYGDNSTITIKVEKTCGPGTNDDAEYHITGHL